MYKFTTMVETEADALFLASCLRGVAATNSIRLLKEDGTPVVDGDPKACPVSEVVLPVVFFTKEQRDEVMKLVDLREYASMCICGDGLEIDRAMQDFEEMSDVDVVLSGILNGFNLSVEEQAGEDGWEAELREQLKELPTEVVDAVVKEIEEN